MNKRISIAILAMGLSGLVAEILILQEMLIVYSGNELCIGIILANWLILEAIRSFRKVHLTHPGGNHTTSL